MTCPCCKDFLDLPGTVRARTHSEGCVWCGARLIWSIQRLPIAKSEASARCKAVLGWWMARGHPEAEIRRLAKLEEAPVDPRTKEKQDGKRNDRMRGR